MAKGFPAIILRTNKAHRDFAFVVERICYCKKYGRCWSIEEYQDWSRLLRKAIREMKSNAEARKYGHVFAFREGKNTLIRAELGSLWRVIQSPREGGFRSMMTSLAMNGEPLETHAIKMFWEPKA